MARGLRSGTVVAIDRDRSRVRALIDPWIADEQDPVRPIACSFLGVEPPLPMSRALFSPDLRFCYGSTSRAIPLLREEFHSGTWAVLDPLYAPSIIGEVKADTYWNARIYQDATISNTQAAGIGVERIETYSSPDYGFLSKNDDAFLLSAADGWWLTVRFRLDGLIQVEFGLRNATNPVDTWARFYNSIPAWDSYWFDAAIDAFGAGGWSPQLSGIGFDSDWHWVDLLLVPGDYVAAWFDGEPVGAVTTNVPTGDYALAPYFYAIYPSGGSGTLALEVDRFEIKLLKNAAIRRPEGILF